MIDVAELAREVDTAVTGAFQRYPRVYLGFSQICYPCPRRAYLEWRYAKFKVVSPRLQRLFDRGHREEERFVYWLRLAGYRVFDRDPITGEQFEYVEHHGHVMGHCDSVLYWKGKKAVVEMKTHNSRSFNSVKKGNNIKFTKVEHYDQMQKYMDAERADFGLYAAVNKDNDALHWECHLPDKESVERCNDRAVELLTTEVVPKRIAENSDYWICTMCGMKGICFEDEPANKSCRMCVHAELGEEGSWVCVVKRKKPRKLRLNEQLRGCPSHKFVSGL